jgi:hypothetical protein
MPKLLLRHDPARIAGTLLKLSHGSGGELRVRCEVADEEAKRCGGFSVTATIHEFELRDVDDPEKFHALVTRATIGDEIR